MENENKALIRRYLEECIGKGDISLMDDLLTPNYAMHMNTLEFDLQGYKNYQPSVLGAFPDGRFVTEDMLAEGNRVVLRYTFYGTHRGEFMGLPATGKQVRVGGILISRIVDGRIAEEWEVFDAATMFRQLGMA